MNKIFKYKVIKSFVMNKLVIIGNGFDLAHGMMTSYVSFIKWLWREFNGSYNEYIKTSKDNYVVNGFVTYLTPTDPKPIKDINVFPENGYFFNESKSSFVAQVEYMNNFFRIISTKAEIQNWLDIEKEYYEQLKIIQSNKVKHLNEVMDGLKQKLSYYLSNEIQTPNKNRSITNHFKRLLHTDDSEFSSLMVLNFNYTNTVEKYVGKRHVNYIHGKLNDKKNPIIFGYGDETDKKYKELEDLEKNEYLKHMKSFAYLQTPNYRKLFNFLDTGAFEIHIMGHSCGVSDRLLFKHIIEHQNFTSVQLYYHEYFNEEKKVVENDFFEKTQNLSRYFDLDSKHKMRTKVIPFNESKPLVPFKTKQTI